MTPLKVSFLIPGFSDGGAQKQCIYLLNELQTRPDIALQLIHLHPGVHDGLLNRDRLDVRYLPTKSNYSVANLRAVRQTMSAFNPDILMSWLHSSDVYGYFVTRFARTKWLMTERDSSYPAELRYWLRKKLGIYADAIVANSSKGDAYWRANGAKGQHYVARNILPSGNREPVAKALRQRNAVFVGRLEVQKNALTVVRAFCLLAQRRPEFSFQVVGEGSLRGDMEAIIAEAGVADRVKLLGFQHDVYRFLADTGAVVSLSHHEGLPNVLLESVSVGTPVVASAIPEHQELLGDDYPFYVEDRDNADAAAAVIERALDADAAGAALQFARNRTSAMSPQAVGDLYMEIFHQLAGH